MTIADDIRGKVSDSRHRHGSDGEACGAEPRLWSAIQGLRGILPWLRGMQPYSHETLLDLRWYEDKIRQVIDTAEKSSCF